MGLSALHLRGREAQQHRADRPGKDRRDLEAPRCASWGRGGPASCYIHLRREPATLAFSIVPSHTSHRDLKPRAHTSIDARGISLLIVLIELISNASAPPTLFNHIPCAQGGLSEVQVLHKHMGRSL